MTNLGAFAVVAEFPHASRIEDYRGLARRRPGLVAVLGLVGTPPTAMFLGKLEVFAAAIDGGFTWLAAVAHPLGCRSRWVSCHSMQPPVSGSVLATSCAARWGGGPWRAPTAC